MSADCSCKCCSCHTKPPDLRTVIAKGSVMDRWKRWRYFCSIDANGWNQVMKILHAWPEARELLVELSEPDAFAGKYERQ